MEDILSSIRRVIARDEAPGIARGVRLGIGEDVLDLQDEEAEAAAALTGTDTADAAEEDAAEELLCAASADAARQSLDALSAALAPPPAPVETPAPPASGRTMEDVVVDTLRPMLKDWLDANLPALVEAMVAKEISRISGRR